MNLHPGIGTLADAGGPHARRDRLAALLFGASAVVTLLGVLLPHQSQVDDQGLLLVAAGAGLLALGLLVFGQRITELGFQLVLASGTVLISLALLFNGERDGGAAGGDEQYYLWVVLLCAYYSGRRATTIQVALIAVAYGVTLAAIDPGPIGPSRWLTTMGLMVGTGIVIRLLSERIERLIRELDTAARQDGLTGLPNRRAFEEQFAQEAARSRRDGRPLAVIVGDLDNFKEINDRGGHAAGDESLAAVARVLREQIRSVDTAARIGGDEFAVLLPGAGEDQAAEVADRIRDAVAANGDGAPVTLSLGVAVGSPSSVTLDGVMRSADEALYTAKRGRAQLPSVAGPR